MRNLLVARATAPLPTIAALNASEVADVEVWARRDDGWQLARVDGDLAGRDLVVQAVAGTSFPALVAQLLGGNCAAVSAWSPAGVAWGLWLADSRLGIQHHDTSFFATELDRDLSGLAAPARTLRQIALWIEEAGLGADSDVDAIAPLLPTVPDSRKPHQLVINPDPESNPTVRPVGVEICRILCHLGLTLAAVPGTWWAEVVNRAHASWD
ncbi:hypothetical protein [Amycolatopsis anabasis]|uniref:hypothetical protein n=1 Tax=Amycolatopsis anabasis TaxID=1840409 RepID=UPI00131C2F4D|nr:hypothetical protein [Amycolatopsis anabasis]